MKVLKWGFPTIIRWDWLIRLATKINGIKITGVEWIPLITVVDTDKPSDQLIRHETIHTLQQLETLFVFYYLIYALDYAILRLSGLDHVKAYKNIIFEKEVYTYQNNKNYLKTRKLWNWRKYFKRK